VVKLLTLGALLALSACAGQSNYSAIETVAVRYVRAPLDVGAAGANELAAVDARGCTLKRRDQAIVLDLLGKAQSRAAEWQQRATPLKHSAILIAVHTRTGPSWVAALPASAPRGDTAVEIRIDSHEAYLAPDEFAFLQTVAARNGCRYSARMEKAA